MLGGSGCSVVSLSLPTSGSDRDGTTDAKVDEAEGTSDLATNKSAAEEETAELSRSDFR